MWRWAWMWPAHTHGYVLFQSRLYVSKHSAKLIVPIKLQNRCKFVCGAVVGARLRDLLTFVNIIAAIQFSADTESEEQIICLLMFVLCSDPLAENTPGRIWICSRRH